MASNHVDNALTMGVTFLRMQFGETELATGSGFFWRASGKQYLVTNWHNVSGRNPVDDSPLSPTAAIPDRITFTIYVTVETPADPGRFAAIPANATTLLYDANGTRLWMEHPTLGKQVDVVALPMSELNHPQAHVTFVNELYPDILVRPHVSQDAFVVGFPPGHNRAAAHTNLEARKYRHRTWGGH
jgi:hypothetical protein